MGRAQLGSAPEFGTKSGRGWSPNSPSKQGWCFPSSLLVDNCIESSQHLLWVIYCLQQTSFIGNYFCLILFLVLGLSCGNIWLHQHPLCEAALGCILHFPGWTWPKLCQNLAKLCWFDKGWKDRTLGMASHRHRMGFWGGIAAWDGILHPWNAQWIPWDKGMSLPCHRDTSSSSPRAHKHPLGPSSSSLSPFFLAPSIKLHQIEEFFPFSSALSPFPQGWKRAGPGALLSQEIRPIFFFSFFFFTHSYLLQLCQEGAQCFTSPTRVCLHQDLIQGSSWHSPKLSWKGIQQK